MAVVMTPLARRWIFMPAIGPYSRPHVLAKLDGRTREARLMQSVREELTAHLGGKPTVAQRALIDRAAWLTLHISQMDRKALEGDGLSERDSRQYLGWSNTLMKVMKALGADRPAPEAPRRTLTDHLREKAA